MAMTATLSYYSYEPSKPAAIVMCALFGVNAIYAIYKVIRTKAWVWSVMILATLMECFGYGVRVKSAEDVTNHNQYIVQFCLIILAPVLASGVIYVVFGRIVHHVVPARDRTMKLLWAPARWITPIFVSLDVVTLLLQLVGAVLVSGTEVTDNDAKDRLKLGKDLALIGISIQIATFALFSIIVVRFQFSSKRYESYLNSRLVKANGEKTATFEGSSKKFNPRWRSILYAVNAACLLILVRSVYREVEFGEGKGGYVQKYEVFFYVFDALPIVLVVILFSIFFPGSYLPHMGCRKPKSNGALPVHSPEASSIPLE